MNSRLWHDPGEPALDLRGVRPHAERLAPDVVVVALTRCSTPR
ncbi:hypothetical protein B005_2986 [Nocardiopsis alba ATCC BAA-2165]|uniref:Uncharacterized protein n=1 Tax=Nocardiopsis alba (strain ATCC BAA-2165 / BE74) TaxID=1205910 RepID=J7LBA1_NOCAA|nr:hypothetical protein B005_2986 [Nocardiopsis alba ATCC BAA-2165]